MPAERELSIRQGPHTSLSVAKGSCVKREQEGLGDGRQVCEMLSYERDIA